MNILVINGSPKGQYSTTLQTSKYLEILHPEHSFSYLDAGSRIRHYTNDFSEAKEMILSSDAIIFSYPVYTFLVPSQLHCFIELMQDNNLSLEGKFATQITTSKHFYDTTAHAFIADNCFDLGLKYIKGLSQDMDDLTKEKGQKDAESFFDYLTFCIQNNIHEPSPKKHGSAISVPASDAVSRAKETSNEVVIVADLSEEDASLNRMIERFQKVSKNPTRLVNIHTFLFQGGCISCFNCATDGTCVYTDGFSDLLRKNIQTASGIVLAYSIKNHSMGSRFKTYDDRQFFNGHRTVTMGLPFGYLVSGNLSCENNLRTVMEARAEVGGNFLAGIATDESDPDTEIDALAEKLYYATEHKYAQPANFYGVGGMKIFRDLIWLMQGMMKADHRFYKSHKQYDFPQKKFGTMLAMYLVGGMLSNQKLKAKMKGKMNEGMLMPYTKVLDKAKERMKN